MRIWQRYCIDVQYAGHKFSGWIGEKLPEQGVLRAAPPGVIAAIQGGLVRFVGPDNYQNLKGSSRTDAGVHALCNRFHVDIYRKPRTKKKPPEDGIAAPHPPPFDPPVIVKALNYYISNPNLRILGSRLVPPTFNAVGSAKARTYRYHIAFNPKQNSIYRSNQPVWAVDDREGFMWVLDSDLDVQKMQEAAQHFVQERDFSAVRNVGCQAPTPIRNIRSLVVEDFSKCSTGNRPHSNNFEQLHDAMLLGPRRVLTITITANAFLYRMVRNIVSLLVSVGQGKMSPEKVEEILLSKNRQLAPHPAPARGLFLMRVHYDEEKDWWDEEHAKCFSSKPDNQ